LDIKTPEALEEGIKSNKAAAAAALGEPVSLQIGLLPIP
jgi:hypothetical protein